MENVHVKINGIEVEVPANYTILQAAHEAGVRIPTLCYLKDINAIAACRICLVEATGVRGLAAACVQQVAEGMEVKTNTPALRKSRKTTLELMLSNHRMDCLSCVRSDDCELRQLAREYGVDQYKYVGSTTPAAPEEVAVAAGAKLVRCAICGEVFPEGPDKCPVCGADKSVFAPVGGQGPDRSPRILRDNSKCILCRRCIAVCQKNQHVAVIGANDRGFETHVASAFDMPLTETPCVNCGQCIAVCPTGALRERDDTDKVWEALNDPQKHVVVGPAPSVRAQIGECFGYPIGTNVEGKLAAALRRLGFDRVFDVDTAADVTIMEEGAAGAAEEQRPAAAFDLLLPRLDQVLRGLLPGHDPEHLLLQEPAGHVRCAHQDLLRRKERHRPQGHRRRLGHALHGEEVRDRARRHERRRRRHSGCGHFASHPRAGQHDQARGHHVPRPAGREL